MAGKQFETAIRGYIDKMPSLPTSVSKVLEICNSPQTSPSDLNRVISVDPVLMGRVMKLINSAYYGLNQEITSLVRAIIMLGINTVKNLALSTAVLGTIGKHSDSKALNMEGFWRHSLCVGVTSKLIAKHRKVDKNFVEEYFIAGLLHDVGKIPFNNRLPERYVDVLAFSDRDRQSLHRVEAEILGFDHGEVGLMVTENWKLSEEIRDAVAFHHRIDEYSGAHRDIVYSVALANYFAAIAEIGFSGNRYPEPVPAKVAKVLDLDVNYIEDKMEDTVAEEIERARIFLKLAG
jgi:putative nucleotidyltransferase with HDIG domain